MRKFIDALKSIVEAIKNYLKNGDVNHRIAAQLAQDVEALEQYEKLWVDALKAAVKNNAEMQSNAKENTDTESSGGKYSIGVLDNGNTYVIADRNVITGNDRTVWRKQITDFFNNLLERNKSIDIYTLNGDILTISKKITSNKSRDDSKYVSGVRVLLSDEEFALKLRVASHIDEIAEASFDKQKKKHPDYKNHSFAKDGFSYRTAYFEDFDGKYYKVIFSVGHDNTIATIYNVGKITKDTLPSAKLIAVVGSKPLGRVSKNILPQNSDDVNPYSKKSLSETDSNGNKLSKQQREYFKDSKVVDENGKLLVVYHQTDKDFTVFDTHHKGAGSYDYETPYGVFLKPTNENIGINGSKQMQLYANITNPLIVSDRTKMSQYLKKNAQYAEYVSKIDEANKTFKAKSDDAINAFKDYLIAWRRDNPKAKSNEIYNDAKFNELFEAEDRISSEWTNTINDLSQQAKGLINKILTADGYDGVIINHDSGSFGRSVKSIIALDNKQVKNVDNESPTSNEDIRFSIAEDMTEQERYEELKDKSIKILLPNMRNTKGIDFEAYKTMRTSDARVPLRKIAEILGIHDVNYSNSSIDFDFAFSKRSLDTSLNHQSEYGGAYEDYAKMLTCLDSLIENAELIEVHKNYKDNEYLKNTFVLISAIENAGEITPVQLEVKEYDKGQNNSLY